MTKSSDEVLSHIQGIQTLILRNSYHKCKWANGKQNSKIMTEVQAQFHKKISQQEITRKHVFPTNTIIVFTSKSNLEELLNENCKKMIKIIFNQLKET